MHRKIGRFDLVEVAYGATRGSHRRSSGRCREGAALGRRPVRFDRPSPLVNIQREKPATPTRAPTNFPSENPAPLSGFKRTK